MGVSFRLGGELLACVGRGYNLVYIYKRRKGSIIFIVFPLRSHEDFLFSERKSLERRFAFAGLSFGAIRLGP